MDHKRKAEEDVPFDFETALVHRPKNARFEMAESSEQTLARPLGIDPVLLKTAQDGTQKQKARIDAALAVTEQQAARIRQVEAENHSLQSKLAASENGVFKLTQELSNREDLKDLKTKFQHFEEAFTKYGGNKGPLDLVAMQAHLLCPGQDLPMAFTHISTKMEHLQDKWFQACFNFHLERGHYPLRDMSNVVFRVHMVKLEHTGNFVYRKRGDYRVGATLIEADGCNSLKKVCKRVCEDHLHLQEYRALSSAIKSSAWSHLQLCITWSMDEQTEGNWGNEFIWRGFYESELRARHEAVMDIWVGIVCGYDDLDPTTVRLLEQGKVEEECEEEL